MTVYDAADRIRRQLPYIGVPVERQRFVADVHAVLDAAELAAAERVRAEAFVRELDKIEHQLSAFGNRDCLWLGQEVLKSVRAALEGGA